MLDYQFTCKHCGRTTFCDYNNITKTYDNRAVTREECAHCGYICYNCRQLENAREITAQSEIVNQDAEIG